MPILGALLLGLAIWGAFQPGAAEAFAYLFRPDFSKLKAKAVLEALGQALFTLSIGMGIMITYGSYLRKDENILSASVWIVFYDTLVSFLAAIAIFSPVFTMNQNPAGGPALVFHVLPVVFQRMWGGLFFGVLFFILLTITALASTISLLEVPVAYLVEERKWLRSKAAWLTATASFLFLGIPCALSFGVLSEVKWFVGRNFFDFLDFISSNILLSLVALTSILFVGFVWGLRPSHNDVMKGTRAKGIIPYWLWKLLTWVICPLSIVAILLAKLVGY